MGLCESQNNQNQMNKVNQDKINQPKNIEFSHNKSISKENLNKNNPIDIILEKLLNIDKTKPGCLVNLKEEEIKYAIDNSIEIIKGENILVELEAPLRICGDIHGQYMDLLHIFESYGYPYQYNYLFLGNYVDYGVSGIEVLCLLLCYKIKYPEKITLLRGNHESSTKNRIYGFYDECKRRYSVRIWRSFIDLFNYLPIASIINDKIFCVHGGLSPYLNRPNDILTISRPTDIPDLGLLFDLLNSNPSKDVIEYDEDDNEENSFLFGEKVVLEFCEKNNLDLIVRGNQVTNKGYEFFGQKKLVTIFSATNFGGENLNSGAMLIIDESLNSSLVTFNHK